MFFNLQLNVVFKMRMLVVLDVASVFLHQSKYYIIYVHKIKMYEHFVIYDFVLSGISDY